MFPYIVTPDVHTLPRGDAALRPLSFAPDVHTCGSHRSSTPSLAAMQPCVAHAYSTAFVGPGAPSRRPPAKGTSTSTSGSSSGSSGQAGGGGGHGAGTGGSRRPSRDLGSVTRSSNTEGGGGGGASSRRPSTERDALAADADAAAPAAEGGGAGGAGASGEVEAGPAARRCFQILGLGPGITLRPAPHMRPVPGDQCPETSARRPVPGDQCPETSARRPVPGDQCAETSD
jgi:hypothetical protein